MAITRVNFGEWLPDQPGVIGALTTAKNVYPKAVGYGPFPEETNYSQPAGENLTNVVAARDTAGSTIVFASSTDKLFKMNGASFTFEDVSATTYGDTERWRFTQFGNSLIAASEANTLQYYDLTTTGNFATISSDAPKAKYVTVVRDFVVTGYQDLYRNRVQWSGINNEKTWASSATTQADFQDIPDGGAVMGVTGGEFGLVLLERSLYRMSYIGTPLIFQFDNITRNLGCYDQNSVIQWQGITYFLSDDGFYSCNGQTVEPIGAEKINRFFFRTLKESDISEMSAAVDPQRNLIIWGYPSTDLTYRVLMFHTLTKRWSYADTTVNRIASSSTPSIDMDNMDAFNASIDNIGIPLDSRVWVGGKLLLSGLRGERIISFTGAPKTGQIDTSDLEVQPDMSMITLVKPIVDNGSGSASVQSRMRLDDIISFPATTAADSENRIGVRSLGKYHRVRLTPTGDNWSSAIGVELEMQKAGYR